jgi:outer membrane murein-binding lipoprotein Lpp
MGKIAMLRLFAAALAMLLIAGCATSPGVPDAARSIERHGVQGLLAVK